MPRYLVAHQNDLQDGDLRQVKAGDTELVLVRARGHVHAYPAHCPHAGGPLAEGLLNGDRLMCPWHHACFSAHTGDLLEPPAQDALVRFDVVTQGDDLYVNLPDDFPESRVPDMTPPTSACSPFWARALPEARRQKRSGRRASPGASCSSVRTLRRPTTGRS